MYLDVQLPMHAHQRIRRAHWGLDAVNRKKYAYLRRATLNIELDSSPIMSFKGLREGDAQFFLLILMEPKNCRKWKSIPLVLKNMTRLESTRDVFSNSLFQMSILMLGIAHCVIWCNASSCPPAGTNASCQTISCGQWCKDSCACNSECTRFNDCE